jgi:hypothetical protein
MADQAAAPGRASIASGHCGRSPSFVNKHQLGWSKGFLRLFPCRASRGDIFAFLLGRAMRFFYRSDRGTSEIGPTRLRWW